MTDRIAWNLKLVGSREARKPLPSDPQNPSRVDWGSIKVGQLDTGYTPPRVFGDWASGEQWLDVANGLNVLEPNKPLPIDPLGYEGTPGHGMRIASVLCGLSKPPRRRDGRGSEIGIAPGLPTIPCRVVNFVWLRDLENRRSVRKGLEHCLRKRCQIISISLGTPGYIPSRDGGLEKAVYKAYESGTTVVAAAGQIIDSLMFPALYGRTIGVGGVTSARRMWYEYDVGAERVDVWAPATDILRADAVATGRARPVAPIEGNDPGSFAVSSGSHKGKIGKGDGTSYATVHVSAAAAMWLRHRGPDIDRVYTQPWHRVEAFRVLLQQTARPIKGKQPGNGAGIPDIPALLAAPLPLGGSLKKVRKEHRP